MSTSPGIYNFTIQRRSDHKFQLVFKDSNDSPIDLTGFTVEAQVWEKTRTAKYADFNVVYTDRQNGKVDLSLTDEQTATFGIEKLSYDVLITDSLGIKEYYLEGDITMSEGYTS